MASLRRCDKCEEMVDEAKAFCPGCGASLLEEEGREATKFEKMDNTVQLGQTMYNQMLSDMGLGKEKGPSAPDRRVEIIEPVVSNPKPTKQAVLVPHSAGSSKIKWIILGAAAILVVGLIILVATGFLLYFFWPRIS